MGEVQKRDEELRQISTKVENLLNKDSLANQIVTRAAHQNELMEFHTIDDAALEKIAERMPAINRATRSFGRKNSQTTNKLMTLNMISTSPLRKMRQCLAQIEQKRNALKERIYKLKKNKIRLDRLFNEKDALKAKMQAGEFTEDEVLDKLFRIMEIDATTEKLAADIADGTLYIEGALKEIGIFQNAYEDLRKENGIPENWDESHYEEAEIEEHIRQAFIHGIRDLLMTGRLNVGTQEYFEQFGINPVTAYALIQRYLQENDQMTNEGNLPDINHFHDFLDQMYETFKDEYKKVIERAGLPNLIDPEFLYREDKDEE